MALKNLIFNTSKNTIKGLMAPSVVDQVTETAMHLTHTHTHWGKDRLFPEIILP